MSISALLGPETQLPESTVKHPTSASEHVPFSEGARFFTFHLSSVGESSLRSRPTRPVYPSVAVERYPPTGPTSLTSHDAIPLPRSGVDQPNADGLLGLAKAALDSERTLTDNQGIQYVLRLKEQRARQKTGHHTEYIVCPFRLCDPEKYNVRVYPSCAQGFRDLPAAKYHRHQKPV